MALMGNPTNYHNLTPKTRTIPSIPYQYQMPEAKGSRKSRFNYTVEEDRREGEVLQQQSIPHRPHKMMRSYAYGGFQSLGSFNGGIQAISRWQRLMICVSRELRVTGRGRREKGWAKSRRFKPVREGRTFIVNLP
ncbi:hypothetical protein AMTRI_Chr07g24850 [Amborella trichopoda]